MSKSISIILGVVVLLLVGALVAPSFVDWNSYKGRITDEVAKSSGYTLKIDGDISLALLPLPHLAVENVTVLNGDNTLTTVKKADISVELFPLLSNEIAIRSVSLTKPVITLATNDAGEPTWLATTPEKTAEEEADAAQKDAQEKAAPAFSIGSFSIENGTFTYKDGQTGKVTSVDKINLDGGMKSLKGPFDVSGSVALDQRTIGFDAEVGDLDAQDGVPVDLTANINGNALEASFEGKANLADKAASGAFAVNGIDLSEFAGEAGEGPFDAKGKITASSDTIQITDLISHIAGLTLEGDLKGANDAAAGQNLALNIRETSGKDGKGLIGQILKGASFKGDVKVSEAAIAFDNFVASLNGTDVKGSGSYSKAQSKLAANFSADKINADQWMKLTGKDTKSAGSSSASKGGSSAQKAPAGFSLPMDMDVKAQIGQLIYQGKNFSDITANISAANGALRISELKLNAPQKTQISASGVIGDTQNMAGLDLSAFLKTDDVEALAASFNAPLPQSEIKVGALDANAKIKGSLDKAAFDVNASGKGLTLSANGTAQNPTTELVLSDLNVRVQHPNMVKAIQIANPSFSMGSYWQKPLDLKTTLSMKDKQITLSKLSGQAGPVPLQDADLTITTGGAVPSVSGDIALGNLVLPGTSEGSSDKASSGASAAGASSSANNGKWSLQAIDSKWMRSMKADLSVKAASLTQNRWVLSQPSIDVKLSDGTLNIPSLKAGLFGGDVAMSGQIVGAADGKGFSSATWKTDGSSINATGLYQAMVNKQSDMISGQITSFSEDIKTSGASMASLISNLNGNAKLNGQNVIIKGIDAAGFATAMGGSFKPVDRASELLGATLYKGQTEFTTITGNFPINSGIVSFTPLTLDGPKAMFDVTGKVNLPAWTIDAVNKITIKNSDVPPFELKIAGSLSNPTKAASSVLENYLQQRLKAKATDYLQEKGIADKINKKLGIPLLGGAQQSNDSATTEPAAGTDTQQPAQQEQPKEQKPEDILKNAVGGFLGGR
ncbi:MAG: AsmA family protein [Pseudobdellovibrionaceae bacterium]